MGNQTRGHFGVIWLAAVVFHGIKLKLLVKFLVCGCGFVTEVAAAGFCFYRAGEGGSMENVARLTYSLLITM